MLEPITRPDGTVYRPRKIRVVFFGEVAETPHSIVVLGTANRDAADAAAEEELKHWTADWCDGDEKLVVDEPQSRWLRRCLSHFADQQAYHYYKDDPVKGAHALVYPIRRVRTRNEGSATPDVPLFNVGEL